MFRKRREGDWGLIFGDWCENGNYERQFRMITSIVCFVGFGVRILLPPIAKHAKQCRKNISNGAGRIAALKQCQFSFPSYINLASMCKVVSSRTCKPLSSGVTTRQCSTPEVKNMNPYLRMPTWDEIGLSGQKILQEKPHSSLVIDLIHHISRGFLELRSIPWPWMKLVQACASLS